MCDNNLPSKPRVGENGQHKPILTSFPDQQAFQINELDNTDFKKLNSYRMKK
jgi:hypothetical protein